LQEKITNYKSQITNNKQIPNKKQIALTDGIIWLKKGQTRNHSKIWECDRAAAQGRPSNNDFP
jgi:hypothetical protein